MNDLMEKIRNNPPCTFGDQDVIMVKDYREGTINYVKEKSIRKEIDLPSSNVVQFILADRSVVTARPSGTEPKIKFYASCSSDPGEEPGNAQVRVQKKIAAIREALKNLIGD
jgi:phosphoglucomutase